MAPSKMHSVTTPDHTLRGLAPQVFLEVFQDYPDCSAYGYG